MAFFKKLKELLFAKEENTPEVNFNLDKISERIESEKKLLDINIDYTYCDFCNSPIIEESDIRKFAKCTFHKKCLKMIKKQVTKNYSTKI